MSMQWFRLYHRIIDDEKLRLLAFEDRWHFVALCCLKGDGLLDEPDDSLRQRKIAVKLGVQVRELEEIGRRLQEVGLIDESLSPVAWDELQYRSDNSSERVKKYREKQRELGEVNIPKNLSNNDTEMNIPENISDLQKRVIDIEQNFGKLSDYVKKDDLNDYVKKNDLEKNLEARQKILTDEIEKIKSQLSVVSSIKTHKDRLDGLDHNFKGLRNEFAKLGQTVDQIQKLKPYNDSVLKQEVDKLKTTLTDTINNLPIDEINKIKGNYETFKRRCYYSS